MIMAECNSINRQVPASSVNNETSSVNNESKFSKGFTAEDLSVAMKGTVWPVTILIGVVAVLGIIGNALIITVYSLRYRRCNFKYFVLCMAIIDITSCLTTLPGEMVSQMHWYNYQHEWICKIKSYFNVFTVWSSALALLLLAYDRYRKICRPLDWQIQPSWAIRSCLISVCISGIVAIPIIILWGKQSYMYVGNHQNITVTICEKSRYYADGIYPFLFIIAAYMVPIFVMICITYVLNFKITKAIFTSIPVSQSSDGTPIQRTTVELPKCHNNPSNKRTVRRYSDVGTSYMHILFPHRLCASMNLHTKRGQSCNLQFDNEDLSLQPLTTSEPNTENGDCSMTNEQLADRCLLNEYSKENVDNDLKIGLSSRTRSCSSSGSLESIMLKERGTCIHSPIHRWRILFSRRRVSEINTSEISNSVETGNNCIRHETKTLHVKRKTKIMIILTTIFTITIILYLVLSCLVANTESILKELTKSEKVIFFLFWRIYFINCVINPVLYGLMDPRFRKGVKEIFRVNTLSRQRSSKSITTHVTVV